MPFQQEIEFLTQVAQVFQVVIGRPCPGCGMTRGLAALDFVAEQPTTPKVLAEVLGVDRSTAYRMLCTLAAHGFVERDPLSERVHLSEPELLAQSIGGMVSEMIRRAAGRRPLTKPAAGA